MSLDRIFEEAESMMNGIVDEYLGDVVEVSSAGAGGPWTERKAFVTGIDGVLSLDALDAIDTRVRIKIAKEFVPSVDRARFRGGKLGARTWRASGDVPENVGLYLLFDLQITSA